MASTITLGGSINFTQAFGGFKQLTIGTASEPAVTAANIILTTILSPPFTWNWNRNSVTFVTGIGQQDYSVNVPTFGFIEKANYSRVLTATITQVLLVNNIATYTAANTFSAGDLVTVIGTVGNGGVFNVTNAPILSATATNFTISLLSGINYGPAADSGTATALDKTSEITNVQNVLAAGTEQGSPVFIAPQLDNNAGTITFRLLPIPDQIYSINVIFQKRIPALMSGTASTWAPVPDHYSQIYQWGFLSVIAAYFEDQRWAPFTQKFVATLLGMAEGLDSEQKNTFQQTWLNMMSEQQTRSQKNSQGVMARQV